MFGRLFRRRHPLPMGQLGDLCNQLAGFLYSGVTVVQALDLLASTTGMPKASRQACRLLAKELRGGLLLPEAMQRLNPLFPSTLIAAMRGADGHGKLAAALLRMGKQYTWRQQQKQQMLADMAYPALLSGMVLCVAWLAVSWLLPQMEPLLTQMETLPPATRILLAGGRLLQNQGGAILAGAVVLGVLLHFLFRCPSVQLVCDRAVLHLPLLGRAQRQVATARFARTLADLYACGASILEAVALAADATGNRWIRKQAETAIRQVEEGGDWPQAIGRIDGFMPQLALCLQIGSQSGALREQLEMTAEVMDRQNALASKQMLNLLEPVSTVVLGALILLLMAAVLLPMYQYYDSLWSLY